MDYAQFTARFLEHRRWAAVHAFAQVLEGGRSYPLLAASTPGARTLLITSGFHGDETAGPVTLLEHFAEIVAYARERGVGLQVYPCLNPSGFEDGTRYNRSQESPNNDFLRYEIEPGVWVGELTDGQDFLRHCVFTRGPKETRALVAELERQPAPAAALDIHQDPYLGGAQSYAYTFGESRPLHSMLAATAGLVPLAAATQVDDRRRRAHRQGRAHRAPRRQRDRLLPPSRRPPHGRARDHDRDAERGRQRRESGMDQRVHRPRRRRLNPAMPATPLAVSTATARRRQKRCFWAEGDPLLAAYHDEEWGVPVHDDRRWYEKIVLDGAQAGLSWLTILRKREAYRAAFCAFDPELVAHFGERDVARLMKDPGIVRNRLKIRSAIGNARAFLALQAEHGSFDAFIWSFAGGRPLQGRARGRADLPARTPLSDELSKALKKRGFTFVGSTIVYAFMQAAGLVNDHVVGCFRRGAIARLR
jgi:DNA-3-methyladenine glycosylase I